MKFNPQLEKREKVKKYKKVKDSELYARKNTISKEYTSDFKYPKSILTFNKENGLHPTQKPLELLKYLVLTYSNEGDMILDNCIGSGTTLRACKDLGRKFIGIEISEEYCRIAKNRLAQEVLF